MSTRPLGVVILGARHPHVFPRIDLLRAHPDVELMGFYEQDVEIATRLAELTGLTAYPAIDALLAGGADVAVVEGLDPQVPELASTAVAAGVRGLLLEKPGAATPEAFFELARELAERQVVVEIGYELHYSVAVDWCREVLRDTVLGQLTLCRFHGGCPTGVGAELWQSIPEDLGGLLYTEGSHMIEIMLELLGLPDRVTSSVRRLPARPPVIALVHKPDMFSAPLRDAQVAIGTLRHEDVAAAIFDYPDKLVSLDLTAWEPTTWCTQWWIELYGTNGSLVGVPDPAEVRLTLREPAGRFGAGSTVLTAPVEPGRRGLVDTYERQLDSLLARVRGIARPDSSGGDTGCGLWHAVQVMRVLRAMYTASADRGWAELRSVDIPEEAMRR